jgi:hypothetical protein
MQLIKYSEREAACIESYKNDDKIDNRNDTNEVTLNDVLMIIIIQDVLDK